MFFTKPHPNECPRLVTISFNDDTAKDHQQTEQNRQPTEEECQRAEEEGHTIFLLPFFFKSRIKQTDFWHQVKNIIEEYDGH